MTLLHQAAQKAVEALEIARTGLQWYRGMMPEYVDGSDGEADEEIQAALSALESALQQQPEPVAQIDESKLPPRPDGHNGPDTDPDSPLVRYGRAKPESGVLLEPMDDGYWTPWHIANEMLRSPLQHQEVPREPVARNALLAAWRAPEPVYFEFDKKKPKPDGFAAYTVLQLHRAFADGVDAASPSTTRQQEDGNV